MPARPAPLLAFLSLCTLAGTAQAEDLPLTFGGTFETTLQSQVTKTKDQTKTTLFDDAELTTHLDWSDWLTINSDIKLERNRNTNLGSYYPDRNAAFRSEGLTLRQLNAAVTPIDGVTLVGGKIHPRFGSAWDVMPGIFYNFGSDYEQDERIGAGIELELPDWMGKATVSAEAYYLDTSFLSNSLLSRPDFDDATADRARKYRREDGGPSNTGGLDSFTLALQGKDPTGIEGLTYQLSFSRQDVSLPDERAETGYSAGASYEIDLTPDLTMTPFVEYTHLTNAGGEADLDRDYVLGGAAFAYGKWELDIAGGLRRSDGPDISATDHQENLSLTYELIEDLRVGGGFNRTRIDNDTSNSFALSATYAYKF